MGNGFPRQSECRKLAKTQLIKQRENEMEILKDLSKESLIALVALAAIGAIAKIEKQS